MYVPGTPSVTPTPIAGNDPNNEGVCIAEGWLGFKVDSPVPVTGSQYGFSWALFGDGANYLDWNAISSVLVHRVYVKGGPNQNLYAYSQPGTWSDAGLRAPDHPSAGQVPAVSHVIVCYTVVENPEQGCTPGYWKNRGVTTGDWAETGYTTSQTVGSVFSVPGALAAHGNASLLAALDFGGGNGVSGGASILLRAAVAALLNAAHDEVAYGMTAAAVISQVNDALTKGASTDRQWRERMLTLAATLDTLNNAGCPLGAMRP
jgi:hypothetical protein